MHVVPTRCTHAFTGLVITSRAEDKVCPAFLSHITQGLLFCFSLAVPTYPYQRLNFHQPSSPTSILISSPSPATQQWGPAALNLIPPSPCLPTSPVPQCPISPAPYMPSCPASQIHSFSVPQLLKLLIPLASQLSTSPALWLSMLLTKLLHPAFLILSFKEGVLSSPAQKPRQEGVLYLIAN